MAPITPVIRVLRANAERIALGLLVLAALLLTFVNLPYAPRTWFDEGSHLHVPETFLRYGVYADISAEGFRYYGPTVGVGPTVMLPITGVFRLFGVGLLQARLVMAVYLLLALASLSLLALRLHGRPAALLTLALLLGSRTWLDWGIIETGRQVLGEIPGIAFIAAGMLAWLLALRQRDWRATVLAGICFGLGLITKNQFVLILPPTLGLLALLDLLYYRAASWNLRLLPAIIAGGMFGAWMLVQLQFLGPGTFAENLALTRQAAGGAIFVFRSDATLRAIDYLTTLELYGGLLIPGLIYALWRCRQRNAQGLAEAIVAVFAALWALWYVGASLAWPRYALPLVAFGAAGVARMVIDLIAVLRKAANKADQPGRAPQVLALIAGRQLPQIPPALVWVPAIYLLVAIGLPTAHSASDILKASDDVQRFTAYLQQQVPAEAVIDTWEPELATFTDHRFRYPPTETLDLAVRALWLLEEPPIVDLRQQGAQYVVLGPFADYTQIFELGEHYKLLHETGPYRLYMRERGGTLQ